MTQRVWFAFILVLVLLPIILLVHSPTARAEKATHTAPPQTRPAAPNAKPATAYYVTNTADSGIGSLRNTIASARVGDVYPLFLPLILK